MCAKRFLPVFWFLAAAVFAQTPQNEAPFPRHAPVRTTPAAASGLEMPAMWSGGEIPEDYAPVLAAWERNFIKANLTEKPSVLSDAASGADAGEYIGFLYEYALYYAMDNVVMFRDDPDMAALVRDAVRGLGAWAYSPPADALWRVYQAFPDSGVRREVLNTLAVIDHGDALEEKVNGLLADRNRAFAAGAPADYPLLHTLVATLGKTGNANSYPVLFTTAMLPYDDGLLSDAQEALAFIDSTRGDLHPFLFKTILNGPPEAKITALRLGLRLKAPDAEKGALAAAALETGLEYDETGRDLRFEAAAAIRELRWVYALPLALKYYYFSETSYQLPAGGTPESPAGGRTFPPEKYELLEAIRCLSVIGNAGAAQVLSLKLGLINSRMEFDGVWDNEVVLALIEALGSLGYKAAFDNLNYTGFLPYPDDIKNAAKDALQRLAW
jgi:hypothetical protein